jgi:hypothetical protein
MARKLKNKQKQKQKQSQRVVVNIDNSKKTVRRRDTERQQQPRVGTTIINNIPQPPIYQQQPQFNQPSIVNPQPNTTIFKQPTPPIPVPPTPTQINQSYYDEQFSRINSNINNLNNRFNQHAGNILSRMNNLNPTQNFVYVQPQQPEPANASYNMFGEDDDLTVQTAQTVESNYTAPSVVNIRVPNTMSAISAFSRPQLDYQPSIRPPSLMGEDVEEEQKQEPAVEMIQEKKDETKPSNKQDDLLKGNYQNEAERNYICPICGRIDSNIGNSNRHLRNDHSDINLTKGQTGEKVSKNKKKPNEPSTTYTTYPERYIEDLIEVRNRPGIERANEKKATANKTRAEQKKEKKNKAIAVDETSSVGEKVEAIEENIKQKPTPKGGNSGGNKVRPI